MPEKEYARRLKMLNFLFHVIDEEIYESHKEQIYISVRFVDNSGFVQKHYFDIIHAKKTIAKKLKSEIYKAFRG